MSVQLITREKVFELNAVIANSVIGWQQALYQDLKNDLDPKDLRRFERRLDSTDHIDPNVSYQGRQILAIEKGDLNELSAAFCELLRMLDINELIFIPVYKDAWLRQKNSYPPVKKALKHIKDIVSDKTYNEGISASDKDIAELFLSVFWISRCNASMCEIYFSGVGSGIVFSICKYGDLHLYFYSSEQKELIKTIISRSGFVEVDICHDIFNETAISGRQIIV